MIATRRLPFSGSGIEGELRHQGTIGIVPTVAHLSAAAFVKHRQREEKGRTSEVLDKSISVTNTSCALVGKFRISFS